uniref:Uncharacterized protein n=1 Tax=Timema poppense TaxID=170557 RepID=A0A7R9H0Y5_TIMPO|nr:unnamed protein product [Timema poppensis]
MTPGPGKTKWNVPASEIARNTNNPIRNIVENLRLDPNPDKPLIALSIGTLYLHLLANWRLTIISGWLVRSESDVSNSRSYP